MKKFELPIGFSMHDWYIENACPLTCRGEIIESLDPQEVNILFPDYISNDEPHISVEIPQTELDDNLNYLKEGRGYLVSVAYLVDEDYSYVDDYTGIRIVVVPEDDFNKPVTKRSNPIYININLRNISQNDIVNYLNSIKELSFYYGECRKINHNLNKVREIQEKSKDLEYSSIC